MPAIVLWLLIWFPFHGHHHPRPDPYQHRYQPTKCSVSTYGWLEISPKCQKVA